MSARGRSPWTDFNEETAQTICGAKKLQRERAVAKRSAVAGSSSSAGMPRRIRSMRPFRARSRAERSAWASNATCRRVSASADSWGAASLQRVDKGTWSSSFASWSRLAASAVRAREMAASQAWS